MFLGFLPEWVGDITSILGLPAIIIAIVMWLLGRKDANRKLNVEEGGLKISEFDAMKAGYKELYDTAKMEAGEAKDDAEAAHTVADEAKAMAVETQDMLRDLWSFVQRLIKKHSLQLTDDERAELERTQPPPRRRTATKKKEETA